MTLRRAWLLWVVAVAAAAMPVPAIAFCGAAVLLLWLPGYGLLRWLAPADRAAGGGWLALAVSLGCTPVVLAWVWRATNERWPLWCVLVGMSGAALLAGSWRRPRVFAPPMFESPFVRRVFAVVMLWTVGCVFASYAVLRVGDRVATYPGHDYIKHQAVTYSLERSALPLRNVFFGADSQSACYYYEYFYLLVATLRAVSGLGVSISVAFGFAAAVVAAAAVALVYLLAQAHWASGRAALVAAVCVSVVGGWDFIPYVVRFVGGGVPYVTLDTWIATPWRMHNMATQYFWCPQHVLSVVVVLLACRLLQIAPAARWWLVVAPVLAATVFGASVYMAMVWFPAAAMYGLGRIRRSAFVDGIARSRMVLAFGVIVIIGAALMVVQARGYLVMRERFGGGLTMRWDRLPQAFIGRSVPPGVVANLLDLPWILFVEFGVGALAFVVLSGSAWKAVWRDPGLRLLAIASVLGVLGMFAIHSSINWIDYGLRVGVMPAMAFAAICVGGFVRADSLRAVVRPYARIVLAVAMLLGLPIGVWEMPLMVLRTFVQPRFQSSDASAIRFLRHRTGANAIVLGEPAQRLDLLQQIDRRMGVSRPNDPDVRVLYPEDPMRMRTAYDELRAVYDQTDGQAAHACLRRWEVTQVLVGSVERAVHGTVKAFDDAAYFEIVYNDSESTVYRVR